MAGGFNAPNRVVLTRDARPGETFTIAVFGINGPISASPRNYIWMRSATLDLYAAERAQAAWPADVEVEGALDATLERVAGGFEFTEGPVWAPDGALLFSSPNTNVIYRWHPEGRVERVPHQERLQRAPTSAATTSRAPTASRSTRRAG